MARYDEWGGTAGPRGYGWAGPVREGGRRGPGPVRGGWPAGPERYGQDFPPRPFGDRGAERGWDAGVAGPGASSGVYGPARYGLGPYYQRLLDRRRPDDELKEEVEEALFYDSWVDAQAITVDVQDGVVTLRGALPDYEEIRYAIDDAWDVDGVRGVRSELAIRDEDA